MEDAKQHRCSPPQPCSSCPGLTRASTSCSLSQTRKAWMAGSSPAMTTSAPFQRRHKERRISNSAILVGRAPRLFEEFIDQGLTDALGHILVNQFERLAHCRVLLRRQRHDLALAGLLDFGQRVLVFLRRLAVAVYGGFLHGLFACRSDICRQ